MVYKKHLITFIVSFSGAALALLLYFYFFPQQTLLVVEEALPPVVQAGLQVSEGELPDFSLAAEQSLDAVVHVKTHYPESEGANNSPFYDFFFGEQGGLMPMPNIASGSGVIINPDGYVVTNNHVIKKAAKVEIVLNDKRRFYARLIGADPTTDIALLKIEGENLPTISFGDSDELKVGEWVLAVGNPFNLTSTVTAGIVSAKGRSLNLLTEELAIEAFIQTDAAVNPGNSGGALVNTEGELVGINTAIASHTGYYAGYSFAVPVSIVRKVVRDLIEYGTVQRALLGIDIKDIDAELAEELRMDTISGVYVVDLEKGGAADKAGVKQHDVILKVEDVIVNNANELREQVARYRPGDKVQLTVRRDSSVMRLRATLRNRKGTIDVIDSEVLKSLGAQFVVVEQEKLKSLELSNGVEVFELSEGKLKAAGMQAGFIITKINQEPVFTVADVHHMIKNAPGAVFIEGIDSEGTTQYYAFGVR